MSSTWLITGATSGFGRLVTERALATDAHVIAVGRRRDRLDDLVRQAPKQITAVALDLTAPDAPSSRTPCAWRAVWTCWSTTPDTVCSGPSYGEVPAERRAAALTSDGHLPELLPVIETTAE
ncbi:SDR family NAD(P)-dependent oxidoreductase [Streptomyces lanatus]|uniref:SDR family NAD(P)-dependent oxidoreductase n=1 Tax=Streptomyces lanatus TaxID=66900 RepID=A0ABV1Y6P4_9ACTN|nr:SDR family NAD(P)-dependent oxidoreductase [Streptomyces lanatus]GHH30314.1 hypothetical protein GCM10018780_89540 [Streptomyces lanatus]